MSCRLILIKHYFILLLLLLQQNLINSSFGWRYKRQTAANDEINNNSYHRPHFMDNRSVIVQLFEWKFVDIATECRTFLGPKGYAGVQVSPVLEHTVVKTDELKHPWWERYELISYRFASRSGDESEFWSMSRICNEHGVRIYVDVVLNHMAAPLHLIVEGLDNTDFMVDTLLETDVNITHMNYPNVSYSQDDFHHPHCEIMANTQDAYAIRNCQLKGHPDLNHSLGKVQKHIVEMMNRFISMGVAGFRIDTARYMWPIELRNIYQQLNSLNTEFGFQTNSKPFIYQDVFDFGLDTVSKTEYITYGMVSEYLYAAELATIFNSKAPLSSLINWGPALGFLPSADALVFIDSHDTQRGLPAALGQNRFLTYKQRIKYIMANVFMLAHPYGGIKRIMSSYYFQQADVDKGPPTEDEDGEDIGAPKFDNQEQCTKDSGWVCEHRWPPLVAMVQMSNYFALPELQEESIVYFQTNGPNQVAFCRGSQAFVAINNDKEMDFNMEVFVCLPPGTYCDVVTGGRKEGSGKAECHGKQLVVNEHGYANLQLQVADGNRLGAENEVENDIEEEETGLIESYGILVIYKDSKIETLTEENLVGGEEENNEEPSNADDNKSVEDQGAGDENHETSQDSDNEEKKEEEAANTQEQMEETKEDGETTEGDENEAESNNETNGNQEEGDPENAEEEADEKPAEDESPNGIKEEEEKEPEAADNEEEKQEENGEKDGETAEEIENEVEEEEEALNNEETEAEKTKEEGNEDDEEETSAQNENEPEADEEPEAADTPESIEGSEQVDLVVENSEENKENQKDVTEALVEGTEINQPRNLEDPNTEEQVERPSADIVETSVEQKPKEIVAAGFLSNNKNG